MQLPGDWKVFYQHVAGPSPVLKKEFPMTVKEEGSEVYRLPFLRDGDAELPLHVVQGGQGYTSFCVETVEGGVTYRYSGRAYQVERHGKTLLLGVIGRHAWPGEGGAPPEDMGTFTAIKPPPGDDDPPTES
jgi:hypothetical protein